MKRLIEVLDQDDGTLAPNVDKWCLVCIQPIWALGWASDVCHFCEDKITTADIQRFEDEVGEFRLYHYQVPEDLRAEREALRARKEM